MDRDAESYGYTWITENGLPIWKYNETGMTWRDAMECYSELEALKQKYQTPTSFYLIEEADYGLDPRKYNFVRNVNKDQVAIQNARVNKLETYIEKLLAL